MRRTRTDDLLQDYSEESPVLRGGEQHGRGGIRTHGTLLTYTHFPGVRLKPLGHPSQHYSTTSTIKKGPELAQAPFFDGQGEIRTLDTLAGMPVFETGAFNHSATCPRALKLKLTIAVSKAADFREATINNCFRLKFSSAPDEPTAPITWRCASIRKTP